MTFVGKIQVAFIGMTLLSACSQFETSGGTPVFDTPPKMTVTTETTKLLKSIPPAAENTVVTVYNFDDQTGQLKQNDNFASYSRAVTQGGLSILNKALLEAADGKWFTVVERGGLKNLLQERQIIEITRQKYATPDGQQLGQLPPMLYAGMLIEGGVVGYDSNVITGGAGANYLGIGGDAKYRRDIVTVDLRAIDISNGQVLMSISSEKTIYSMALSGNAFKFVSFAKLFQAETGYTYNEPGQLAVRQAIESGVYSMIMEGAKKGYWHFADPQAGALALNEYEQMINEDTHYIADASAYQPVQNMPASAIQLPSGPSEPEAAQPPANQEPQIPLNPALYPAVPQSALTN